ncbi:MAG: CHAT domain-containing tetratricopeptide repeat protein [Hyphomicrobium sp.]
MAYARGILVHIAFSLVIFCSTAIVALGQSAREIEVLEKRYDELDEAGRHNDAIEVAKRLLELNEKKYGPNHAKTGNAVNTIGEAYRQASRYSEAERFHKRGLAMARALFGPDAPAVGTSMNNLGLVYEAQARYADAEQMFKKALLIYEKSYDRNDPRYALIVSNLGLAYKGQGNPEKAEPHFARALKIMKAAFDADHPRVIKATHLLTQVHDDLGRFKEAEDGYRRTLAARERILPPDHPDLAISLHDLAHLHRRLGRYSEAEPLLLRSIAIYEKAFGAANDQTAGAISSLAELYRGQEKTSEAEAQYKRALEIFEAAQGLEHPDVANCLTGLALLYDDIGRTDDSEGLHRRALTIATKVHGSESVKVADMQSNLGLHYVRRKKYAEAEPLLLSALKIYEKQQKPASHVLNNLGGLYLEQSRPEDPGSFFRRKSEQPQAMYGSEHHLEESRLEKAEIYFKKALEQRRTAYGDNSSSVAESLGNLAEVYSQQRRYDLAEQLQHQALAIRERLLGATHPDVNASLNGLAITALEKGDLATAEDYWRRSTRDISARVIGSGVAAPGRRASEADRMDWQYWGLVKVAHRSLERGADERAVSHDMFKIAQWAQASEAAKSLSLMSARGASSDPVLAAMVRERQDLSVELSKRDQARTVAIAMSPKQRSKAAEAENTTRIASIQSRVAGIDAKLKADFSSYAAIAAPEPMGIEEVQEHLHADEALVLFLETGKAKPLPEETFVWVVTKADSRWVSSSMGSGSLLIEVAALLCGLNNATWENDNGALCSAVLGLDEDKKAPASLPFDAARAHALYAGLLGPFEDMIKGKNLLVVPSGQLRDLPIHVLVTAKPDGEDMASYDRVAWLARSHAVTVLPAVSSLKTLRQNFTASRAPQPYIGFGDPVLPANSNCVTTPVPDTCPGATNALASAAPGDQTRSRTLRVALPANSAARTARGFGSFCPLPETAAEINCVAQSLGAESGAALLGTKMTEAALKSVALENYRIIHFATHGLQAREVALSFDKPAEDALVMTPPAASSAVDDGLLTASEIMALRLDADWVIMSACNTVGSDNGRAEAMSGLARAFFYAGARALLVSHWPVNSYAATMLTSTTFAELKRDPKIGRAEAFRRAMVALMKDKDRSWAAHPSIWAPFVVVGEGGAG